MHEKEEKGRFHDIRLGMLTSTLLPARHTFTMTGAILLNKRLGIFFTEGGGGVVDIWYWRVRGF